MKQLTSKIMRLMMVFVATMSLSSCILDGDEDAWIADSIAGRWVGQLSEYYYDRYSWTVSGRDYYTVFEFYQQDRYSGRGQEIDYSKYDYKTYNFRWYVQYGNIYIEYSDGTRLEIDGYSVRDNRLYGKTLDGTVEVNLVREEYYDGFRWNPGYYSRKADQGTFADEEPTDSL